MSYGKAMLGVTCPRTVSGSREPDGQAPMSALGSPGPGPWSQPATLTQASQPACSTGFSWHFQSVHPAIHIITVPWEGTHCPLQSDQAGTLHAGQGEGVPLATSPTPTSRLPSPGPGMTPGAPAGPRPLLLQKAPGCQDVPPAPRCPQRGRRLPHTALPLKTIPGRSPIPVLGTSRVTCAHHHLHGAPGRLQPFSECPTGLSLDEQVREPSAGGSVPTGRLKCDHYGRTRPISE